MGQQAVVEVKFQGEQVGSHTDKDTTYTLHRVADDVYVVHLEGENRMLRRLISSYVTTTARRALGLCAGMSLALVALVASFAFAAEITNSRTQAESINPTRTTKIYLPRAAPDDGSTPNALRYNVNGTWDYPAISIPSGSTVNAVVVRSRCASTCTGSPTLNVVVNGGARTAQLIPKTATTFTDRSFALASPISGPATVNVDIRTGNTTTANRVVADYFFLDGTNPAPDTTPPDTTPLDTTITDGPGEGSTDGDGNVSFTFTGSDNVGVTGFECSLVTQGSADNFVDCSSPKDYTNLANGSYTFKVRAKDAAGNVDGSPATRNFSVSTVGNMQAYTAKAFLDSMGVVAHWKDVSTPYGSQYAQTRDKAVELGIIYHRDALVKTTNTSVYNKWSELGSLGIRLNLTVNKNIFTTPPTASELNTAFSQAGGSIESLEGPNEYNATHQGTAGWEDDLRAYQCALFNNLNASSQPNMPLLAAALGKPGGQYPPETPELGDCSDLNNIHAYPGGNHPTGSGENDAFDSLWFDRDVPKGVDVGLPDRPIYMTETGYSTADDSAGYPHGVSQEAHRKYGPRLSAECFNARKRSDQGRFIERCYHYQLQDHRNNGPGNPQSHFGLIDYSGNQKPVYKALENMVDLIDEPAGSSYSSSPLSLEVQGALDTTHHLLLQNRAGVYYLLIWQEVRSYDKKTDTMINVPPDNVTISFGSAKNVKVFEPGNVSGWAAAQDFESTTPARTLTGVSSFSEDVVDEVEILRIG